MKDLKTKILAIISTIVLSIIATTIYDIFVSPIYSVVIQKIINLPSVEFSKIGDWYARQVSFASDAYMATGMRGLFTAFVVIFILFGLDLKPLKGFFRKNFVCVILVVLIFMSDYFMDLQINNDAHDFQRNIEIVSPYITDQEYKELKSDFYSMDTIDDYQDLSLRLENIAESNNIELK